MGYNNGDEHFLKMGDNTNKEWGQKDDGHY